MANRKTKYTLDHILPERKDSVESFYRAINSQRYSVKEEKSFGFCRERKDPCCYRKGKEK